MERPTDEGEAGVQSVEQGCSGAGTTSPTFFRQGGRVSHSPTFLDWNSCKSQSTVATGYILKRSVR